MERSLRGAPLLRSAALLLRLAVPLPSFRRSERFAPSLRPRHSAAPGARLARFGCSARSLRSLPPQAMASVLVLRSLTALGPPALACVGRSLRALRSLRSLRSLALRPPLARLAPSALSLRGLRSVAPRPSLGCSALSAPFARSLHCLRSGALRPSLWSFAPSARLQAPGLNQQHTPRKKHPRFGGQKSQVY